MQYEGKILPRFSIDSVMPHMQLEITRNHYLMFFRMLRENLGGQSLIPPSDAVSLPSSQNRPVVLYEYANDDLEAATMTISFLMESFTCTLDIGLILETRNLTVSLSLLNDISPTLDVSLSNVSFSHLMNTDTPMTMTYEWNEGGSSLNIAMANLHGKMVPHLLLKVATFFAMEEMSDQSGIAVQEKESTNSTFQLNVKAPNVKLSFPQDFSDVNGQEFIVGANFEVIYETFPNSTDNLQQRLTVNASDCEALLKNANRQGCSDTLVQLIEPATMNIGYQGFVPFRGQHQDKIELTVSPIEVFLSYEDFQVLLRVFTSMQNDMQNGHQQLTLSKSASMIHIDSTFIEVQRHITCDIKRMQLTLINDSDGCDMGLLQLELPTCRMFINATSTNDVTTATGGGDISFAASYYNPDSRIWHPLCPEWKLNATVMTSIAHTDNQEQLNSMQWTISADSLKFTVTHGLLEALASAGGSLMKNNDESVKNAPCVIKNETGLPIEYWWSAESSNTIRVENNDSADIHYVHVKGKGSGVTRTYTSNNRDHGTLCVQLVGMNLKPVEGIVVEQLGVRPFALIESGGNLSKLSVTCDTQLVGGHIVLAISSHLRVRSHLSNEIQLLIYDPTWKSPVELGYLKSLESISIPVALSLGSELRVRFKRDNWGYSSPIPIDPCGTSTITVTSTNSSQHAVFCISLDKGLIELYEPYVLENKLPVSLMFQAKDSQSLPRGDDIIVGCKSGIWWCRGNPMFALSIPGCENTFSLVLKRLDKQPLTVLVSLSENAAKSVTITVLADMWIINRTGLELIYGNDNDDTYIPQARSVIGKTDVTLYSTPSLLRFKMAASSWSSRFKADPRRMNWQDECLTLTSQGHLYEFGVSSDYATRHFGVLTTLVSVTPRYVVVNHSPWTLILLEDDGSLHTLDDLHHIVNAGEAYSLYWIEGKRRNLRASVVGLNGTSSWSETFSIDAPNTIDLIIPNTVYCPFLQVSVKTGGLTQATFVVDIVRMDNQPDFEQSKWDVINYDIKMTGLEITLTDSSKSNPAFELFRGVQSEDVARFSISNIRFDSFKDRTSTQSHLQIGSIQLEDLMKGSKYPVVVAPSARSGDFVQFTYVSKRHPKYAYIEKLTLAMKDVRLQTSMKFVDRINSVLSEVSTHFKGKDVDLLTYFTAFDSMEISAITGRKTFFEHCQIQPINVVVSFVREKDDRIDPSAGFWLSNLKFRIKDASLVLDAYKMNNAFATQESVLQAVAAFYVSSMKGQALNLIESIQVTSLVTGVVKDSVSSIVSTLIGKSDASLASASFRYESLSNQGIISKHSEAMKRCTSPGDFPNILNHLVYDWDGNHTGLEARACIALGIMNNSRQSVVLQVYLKDGAEIRMVPTGRNYLDASRSSWSSERALIVFAWGYTPTLLTTGDICIQVQSNAFNLYISKNSTRLQPNPGYSATFTVQEKQSWWSKYMIIVGDDLQTQEVSEDSSDTYEVLFTSDALGIVAKQEDYQTVVVRECCYFSNGQPGPALATGRISEGDAILSVNGIPVKSTQAFKEIIVNTSRPIVVRFRKATFDLFGEAPEPKKDKEYSLFG
ncbi:Aste57867_17293 [Aphanomyces stellatus]|uniref:Aste57867_17293 protein n=2 Tax=Aphanomyces stellatus TaxID=120398 RepID=A0A485L887_9STRA|nr:hypothetical protein As57867_017234 [Aphanomyces stellatus]VFT94049.1 Aste57867_17293 [Aphanomyces stellatus]